MKLQEKKWWNKHFRACLRWRPLHRSAQQHVLVQSLTLTVREQSFQRHSFGEIKEKNTFHVVPKLIHPPTACTCYSVFRSLNTMMEKKHERSDCTVNIRNRSRFCLWSWELWYPWLGLLIRPIGGARRRANQDNFSDLTWRGKSVPPHGVRPSICGSAQMDNWSTGVAGWCDPLQTALWDTSLVGRNWDQWDCVPYWAWAHVWAGLFPLPDWLMVRSAGLLWGCSHAPGWAPLSCHNHTTLIGLQ